MHAHVTAAPGHSPVVSDRTWDVDWSVEPRKGGRASLTRADRWQLSEHSIRLIVRSQEGGREIGLSNDIDLIRASPRRPSSAVRRASDLRKPPGLAPSARRHYPHHYFDPVRSLLADAPRASAFALLGGFYPQIRPTLFGDTGAHRLASLEGAWDHRSCDRHWHTAAPPP
jgi:hypothetical protein